MHNSFFFFFLRASNTHLANILAKAHHFSYVTPKTDIIHPTVTILSTQKSSPIPSSSLLCAFPVPDRRLFACLDLAQLPQFTDDKTEAKRGWVLPKIMRLVHRKTNLNVSNFSCDLFFVKINISGTKQSIENNVMNICIPTTQFKRLNLMFTTCMLFLYCYIT